MNDEINVWRKCSTCKAPIPFEGSYYKCSVSTCNRKGKESVFCSMECFDAHVPVMNHKDAWGLKETAPKKSQHDAAQSAATAQSRPAPKKESPKPVRRAVVSRPSPSSAASSSSGGGGPAKLNDDAPKEILIVVSRLKAYIKARSGMRTSDEVLHGLSDIVRSVCDEAIHNATRAEQKTVLARDLPANRY
jgi:hypothetical protein